MYNIKDFGAVGDGINLDSPSIQKTIDECAKNGGGTVLIPAGKYVCGTMHIKSHIHILIEKGALILGSKNKKDFDPYEENPSNCTYQDRSHSYFHHSLFHADNEEDIAITGEGTIDMQHIWDLTAEQYWCRACKIIAFKECKDIIIKDLKMRNATDLAVYVAGCENVIIKGLDLIVHIDGISPDSCKNVVISDCIVDAGDDGIVPKCSYTLGRMKYMENLVISNCVIKSRCNAIKFGTESNSGFINTSITGCSIYNTVLSGIAVESVDGALINGFSVSNITMKNVSNPLLVMILNRLRGPEGTTVGSIKNLSINNVSINGPYVPWTAPSQNYWAYIRQEDPATPKTYPLIIVGQEDSLVENVSISDVNFVAEGGGTEEDRKLVVPDLKSGYPECRCLGDRTPVYGLFARYVNNLKMYNVEFSTEKEDKRDSVLLENVTNLKVI